jgi:hypothetical protein
LEELAMSWLAQKWPVPRDVQQVSKLALSESEPERSTPAKPVQSVLAAQPREVIDEPVEVRSARPMQLSVAVQVPVPVTAVEVSCEEMQQTWPLPQSAAVWQRSATPPLQPSVAVQAGTRVLPLRVAQQT